MTVAVVRRLIVFALLFALVTIAAVGLAGLIERVIGLGSVLVVDTAGLARALAFVLVGAPLAMLVWRWQRRRLAEPLERAALVWSVYLAAMTLTSLISTVILTASALSAAVEGEWRPDEVAAALVWAGVWMWHRRMRRSPDTVPTRLPALSTELSALFGLMVAAFGAGSALAALISRALASVAPVTASTSQFWPLRRASFIASPMRAPISAVSPETSTSTSVMLSALKVMVTVTSLTLPLDTAL